jgi:type II secretory pathway component PulF
MLPVLKALLSAVTVCVALSLLLTVMVLPAFTVMFEGWKAKFLMVMVFADALVAGLLALVLVLLAMLVVVLELLLLPPPQAASTEPRLMTAAPVAAKLVNGRTTRSFRPGL